MRLNIIAAIWCVRIPGFPIKIRPRILFLSIRLTGLVRNVRDWDLSTRWQWKRLSRIIHYPFMPGESYLLENIRLPLFSTRSKRFWKNTVPILNNRSGICPKRPWRIFCMVIRGNSVWRMRRSGYRPISSRRTREYWSMLPCRRKIRLPRKRINGRNSLFPWRPVTCVTVNVWTRKLYISI